MDANKTINDAVRAFQAGRGDEGQQLLEKVLKYQPTNQQAVRLLAQIQQQTPRALVSVETLRRVAEAQPQNALVHELLANFLIASDPPAAEQSAREALRLNPNSSPTYSLLGETLLAQRKYRDSAEAFQTSARLKPNNPFPVVRLAEVLARAGRAAQAVDLLQQSAPNHPGSAEMRHALGNLLAGLERPAEAEAAYREAIRIRADYTPAHGSLGMLLQQVGRADEAERAFVEALRMRPNDVMLNLGHGHVLIEQRKPAEAEAALRRAVQLAPRHPGALVSLSLLLGMQGRPAEAYELARRAAQLAPNAPEAMTTLGHAMHALGRAEDAMQALLRGWQLGGSPVAGSNLLHAMNYVTNVAPEEVLRIHRAWAERHADRVPAIAQPHPNDRDPERRLKVGYVSPDLRAHAVSHFVEPLLEGHDRARVEVFCYASVRAPDAVTERLQSRADQWRDVSRMSDARAAELIVTDGIDVLVDLAGHTEGNRLGVFARRPAPVQVTYLGYPNTTGMSAIGYRLTDAHADPADATDRLHTERLIRLTRSAWCYRPPEPAPEVSDLPARRNGRFTFGSFNRLAKVSQSTASMWARAVNAVPGARFVFKTAGLNEPVTEKYVREMFAKLGVDGDRLVLLGPDASQREHLERYAEIDLALDCYPYHGTTTSCEAMWMGVPSVALVAQTHVSRVAQSLLTSVGLTEFAATSPDQFVEIASKAAGDLERLGEIRRTLRDRMRASPLMDVQGFAREVEDAYRTVWREWCATPAAAPAAAPATTEAQPAAAVAPTS